MDLPPVTAARTGVDCKFFGCWPHQAAVPAICAGRDLCNPCGRVQPVSTTVALWEAMFPTPRPGHGLALLGVRPAGCCASYLLLQGCC